MDAGFGRRGHQGAKKRQERFKNRWLVRRRIEEVLWKNQKQNWGCGSGDCSNNVGDEEEESLEGPRTGTQHREAAAGRNARKKNIGHETRETGEEGMQGGYGHDAEE